MKRGDTFTHASWLDENHKPLVCRVTKVQRGLVYWRPVGGGGCMYFKAEDAAKYVKQGEAQ